MMENDAQVRAVELTRLQDEIVREEEEAKLRALVQITRPALGVTRNSAALSSTVAPPLAKPTPFALVQSDLKRPDVIASIKPPTSTTSNTVSSRTIQPARKPSSGQHQNAEEDDDDDNEDLGEEDSKVWQPPGNQRGDGRTKLNDKFKKY